LLGQGNGFRFLFPTDDHAISGDHDFGRSRFRNGDHHHRDAGRLPIFPVILASSDITEAITREEAADLPLIPLAFNLSNRQRGAVKELD
jgi:hypothetical protein